jgi:hypothetical protein
VLIILVGSSGKISKNLKLMVWIDGLSGYDVDIFLVKVCLINGL